MIGQLGMHHVMVVMVMSLVSMCVLKAEPCIYSRMNKISKLNLPSMLVPHDRSIGMIAIIK